MAHVRRHWRDVAMGCGALWAFLAFETRHWHSEEDPHKRCLEGAGDCPLTVFHHQNFGNTWDLCCRSDYADEVGLGEIERLLPRIRDLVVVVETDYATETLWDTLSEPAMSPERFQVALRQETYSGYVGGVLPYPTFDLPDQLFASTTPRSQSLAIASVYFSWSNSLCSLPLRHLGIIGEDTNVDMVMFLLLVLQTLPCLEGLTTKSFRRSPRCNSPRRPSPTFVAFL